MNQIQTHMSMLCMAVAILIALYGQGDGVAGKPLTQL